MSSTVPSSLLSVSEREDQRQDRDTKDASDDEDDAVVAIGETLIHEIGHYFGLSEEEIEEIEERYWRGNAMDETEDD